jgi:dynein heavy chain
VKKELPKESEKFIGIDKEVKAILKEGSAKKNALAFSNQDKVMERLEEVQKQLTLCEKALNDFMDSKRRAFPRFYFVSPADLLDILSNGNNPTKVMIHMSKIFQAIETLKLQEDGDRPYAIGMDTCVGKEYVEFHKKLKLVGKVEIYFQDIIDMMKASLNVIAAKSVVAYDNMEKNDWLKKDPSQVTLVISLVIWVR